MIRTEPHRAASDRIVPVAAAPIHTLDRCSKKYREVRKALRAAGWIHVRAKGDHEQWKSPDGRTVVTVAGRDGKDVPVGTLKSIRQSTGLEDLR